MTSVSVVQTGRKKRCKIRLYMSSVSSLFLQMSQTGWLVTELCLSWHPESLRKGCMKWWRHWPRNEAMGSSGRQRFMRKASISSSVGAFTCPKLLYGLFLSSSCISASTCFTRLSSASNAWEEETDRSQPKKSTSAEKRTGTQPYRLQFLLFLLFTFWITAVRGVFLILFVFLFLLLFHHLISVHLGVTFT